MHRHSLRVPYSDTDQGGIVHHASYLRYLEVARIEMLRACGLSYRELEENERLALAVVQIEIKYILPARFDDVIEVTTGIADIGAATLKLSNSILREQEKLTEATVTLVGFDLDSRRARRLHPALTEKLATI